MTMQEPATSLPASANDEPLVTVIMPVRNEAQYIARSLGAVLAQTYPAARVEVIVVDGDSEDGTGDIAANLGGGRVTVLCNPRRTTPTSLNLGIAKAQGQYIIRVDGHCEIQEDYIARCVEVLMRTGYDVVGGACTTEGESERSRAIAVALSSRFGVGNVAFRVQESSPGFVDTVPFGAWPRELFAVLGGFDEELVRNQDDELNFRVLQSGGRVWYDPQIRARYYSRSNLRSLTQQYFEYGCFKLLVAHKRGGVASPRHLVPAAFVLALGIGAGATGITRQRLWLAATLLPYLTANGVVSLRLSRRNGVSPFIVSAAFMVVHASYGFGFLWGVVRWRDRLAARLHIATRNATIPKALPNVRGSAALKPAVRSDGSDG